MITRTRILTFTALLICCLTAISKSALAKEDDKLMSSDTFAGLELRNIGPALKSGRIADIEIDPNNRNVWFIGVASGGIWKTLNAGTTWTPVFDKEAVYSIGSVTIDPSNSATIWVGTGENVAGRHMSFGDGIYVSHDGGSSWQNKGLKQSEHISEIIVHPKDPQTLWVAAQGPLWSKGGQRGLFKSTDGGDNWRRVLGDNQWVGVTDVKMDPRNPDRLYAATWQRHRTVAALLDGGPGSGIYRSEDGGESWIQLNPAKADQKEIKTLSKESGLPESDMGKIGIAISPINPDVIYAAIELDRRKGAVYRSTDRGATWEKRSDAVAGGTGPHYYQELYASPHNFDEIFLANVRMLHSTDGGTTFTPMKEEHKHSDNHALSFLADDKDYMIMGSDGGLYESFDHGTNWRFVNNLPITQFYKVAVDDSEPFYQVYGGAQDNGTQVGPSRTASRNGIRNADWEMVLFADGYQPATEPGNPSIMYAEWQQGSLMRVDRTTGELVYIQPLPEEGAAEERYNWDAPILVSPHKSTRLYYASQRVWRSDNRGDTWTPISEDLTNNLERITQPIMDGQASWDSVWDIWAMSTYSTITSLAESPLQEGLIYAGSDDGLIQVTENGGKSWRKIKVKDLPGVPEKAFINDIKADRFNADTVYVALDNHKSGDYKPYLLKSTNRGKSWKSIAGDLPEKHLLWRVVQDRVKPGLMFAATEFGVFFTVNGGTNWIELTGGVPTISFRDLAIQERENDLVAASFGRGFFILDDYSALRQVDEKALNADALLFPARPAWWYIEQGPLSRFELKGDQGANYYTAPNPPFGATFTYYLKDSIKSAKEIRGDKEAELRKAKRPVKFPGWDAVEAERRQADPVIWLTITDQENNVVRRIQGVNKKGFNRVTWDLGLPDSTAITEPEVEESDEYIQSRLLAAPGEYTVSLSQQIDGNVTPLSEPQKFTVKPLTKGSLPGATAQQVADFWQQIQVVSRDVEATYVSVKEAMIRVKMMALALNQSQSNPGSLDDQLNRIRTQLMDINHQLNGNQSRQEVYLTNEQTVANLLDVAVLGTSFSTYGPTPTHKQSLARAISLLDKQKLALKSIVEKAIPEFEKKLRDAGAPWIKGQQLP